MEEQTKVAKAIIQKLLKDEWPLKSFAKGRRNNDCVDLAIAYCILSFDQSDLCEDWQDFYSDKLTRLHDWLIKENVKEHFINDMFRRLDRIQSYLDDWLTNGILSYLTRPKEYYLKESE